MTARPTLQRRLALAAALALAGTVAAARADEPLLRARGNEPSWSLELTATTLSLSLLDGRTFSIAAPTPEQVDRRTARYAGQAGGEPLVVTVVDRVCHDSMSGMPHPRTVLVSLAGRPLEGCGGDPAALLAGPEWTATNLAGRPPVPDSSVTLSFLPGGQLAGSGGCNRFVASYTLSGEALVLATAQAAMTQMACPDALMEQETRVMALLAAVTGFQIGDAGELSLVTADGRRIVARRTP